MYICNDCNCLSVYHYRSILVCFIYIFTHRIALTHWGRGKIDAVSSNDIFNCSFLYENARICIKISLKFVPNGPINNILALVQIMAGRRPGDKSLSESIMVTLPTHICVTRPQWVKVDFKYFFKYFFQVDFLYFPFPWTRSLLFLMNDDFFPCATCRQYVTWRFISYVQTQRSTSWQTRYQWSHVLCLREEWEGWKSTLCFSMIWLNLN